MINKLRNKFILVNMILVAVVLLCVFTVVCTSTYKSLRSDIEHSLQIASDPKNDKPEPPQIGGNKYKDQGQKIMAVYAVVVDDEGEIIKTYQNNTYMSEDVLSEAIDIAYESAEQQGWIKKLDIFYMKKDSLIGTKLAFADSSHLRSSMNSLVGTSVLVGACSMAAFFFISLFLSRWALKPVEKAWKQQQQFVADASHELKTPLTVILANNNIIKTHKKELVESQEKWIDSTEEEASHMRNLVDELLFLAKADSAEYKRLISDIDLSELAWNIVLQFEPIAYENDISIDADIQEGINIRGDQTQLKQLLHILLDNACKYAGEKGKVKFSIKRRQNNTVLSVYNSGAYIPKEDLPHIFERFYRADKARTREGGFGLGLAIAKSIVDNMGGDISAESSESTGTVFTVRFGK